MTMRTSEDAPIEDFRPEDFRGPLEGGLPVSPDFVDTTLARVLADRARIEREAARVDEVHLPEEVLSAYAVPEPSPDFVARTWARHVAQRHDEDARLLRLLGSYRVPIDAPDFVARTVDALRVERSGFRLVGPRTDAAAEPPRRWRGFAWAAAAAILLVTAGILLRGGGASPPSRTELAVGSAQRWSTAEWATTLERLSERRHGGLRIEPVDALHLLAFDAGEGGR